MKYGHFFLIGYLGEQKVSHWPQTWRKFVTACEGSAKLLGGQAMNPLSLSQFSH